MPPRVTPTLRYQVRYQNDHEPETLIATDVADALRQARNRSYQLQSPVTLWSDGVRIAECPIAQGENLPSVDGDLLGRLAAKGVYVVGWSEPVG